MNDINIDDLDPATLTLCVDCAKHPSLKRFVTAHAGDDTRCGICLNKSEGTHTCGLQHRQSLVYLIRSLIRFFYDESDYNSHWGADETTESLLQQNNPILEHENWITHFRSKDRSSAFLEDIFSNDVYPPFDEGVSVYAGFDDGMRLMHESIPRGGSAILRAFQVRLQKENYFTVEPDVVAAIEKIADRIALTVPTGSVYYRARIGDAGRYLHHEDLDTEVRYKPYQSGQLALIMELKRLQ